MSLLWAVAALLLLGYVWVLGPGVTFHFAGKG
jgi:hypothetical protein